MWRQSLVCILLINLLSGCAPAATPAPPVAVAASGVWLGAVTGPEGAPQSWRLDFSRPEAATLTLEPELKAWPLAAPVQTGRVVTVTVAGASAGGLAESVFVGELAADNNRLTGALTWAGGTGAAVFWPLAAPTSADLQRWVGVYGFPSGRAVSVLMAPSVQVGQRQMFGAALVVTDFETGALRPLYPLAADRFLVGAARGVGAPPMAQITFESVAGVARLRWQSLDAVTFTPSGGVAAADQLPVRTETARYPSGVNTTLVGRFSLPPGAGPFPAFVLVHGSEPGTRDGFGAQLMRHYLASRGIALLSYDKRGVGDSDGVYRESADEANLRQLAADALAGVAWLRGRPEVDPARIGLVGGSQAGWVIPLAAEAAPEVALFVILSGPVVSVGHEGLYSAFTHNGESPPSADAAMIAAQLQAMPPTGFDPGPILRRVRQPGLWLWGGHDMSVPVAESQAQLQALIAAGQSQFHFVLFPNADHGLAASRTGLRAELPLSPGLTHYAALSAWLADQLGTP